MYSVVDFKGTLGLDQSGPRMSIGLLVDIGDLASGHPKQNLSNHLQFFVVWQQGKKEIPSLQLADDWKAKTVRGMGAKKPHWF